MRCRSCMGGSGIDLQLYNKNDINESTGLRRNYSLSSFHWPGPSRKKTETNGKFTPPSQLSLRFLSNGIFGWCCDKLSSTTQKLLMLQWKLLTTSIVSQVKARPYLTADLDGTIFDSAETTTSKGRRPFDFGKLKSIRRFCTVCHGFFFQVILRYFLLANLIYFIRPPTHYECNGQKSWASTSL